MSKLSIHFLTQILAAVVATTLSLNVMGASRPTTGSRTSPQLSQSYVWYDGDREQKVWLNPQVVAEFNPGKLGATVARRADANAKMLPMKRNQAGVRLWQMNNTGDAAIRGLSSGNPTGKYSPVFHVGPSTTTSMRALPGNIIVYLNPAWDGVAVKSWLKARKLEVVKKLEIGPNIYVLKTRPGLEALDTANKLYKSGEVKAAFPDWWQEVETK